MNASAIVLSVIAPCLNEEDNVPVLVERTLATFDRMGIEAELVLVDDGSTDRTWERMQRALDASARVRLARHPENRGIEQGWRTGLETAVAPLVCLIDSDLQNRPEDIELLYQTYQANDVDIVQGTRRPTADRGRLIISRALNHMLNVAFQMRLRDNKSGFVLCKREVLKQILTHRYQYRYFQSFIGVAAGARGYRFAEVDTRFERRQAGKSFLADVPVRVSLRICVELLKYRAEVWQLTQREK